MRNAIYLLALLCAACSSTTASLPTIRPYHMDIQQGNVVTPKMMMQLKPGMTKSQVRFVMGTPLISDSFHADRWDYFYSMKKDGHLIEQRRVILEFENDQLKRVRGDVIPAGSAGAGASEQDKPTIKPTSIWENQPAVPKEKEKGMLDKLKFWGDDKKPAQKPEPKPEAQPEAKPAPAPEQAAPPDAKPVVEEKPQDKAATPQEEKKGLLDKLKFWGDDKKPEQKPEQKPEAQPAAAPESEPMIEAEPQPEPKPEPVIKPEALPAKGKPAPQQEKGLLDKLKFWGDDKEAAPKPEPKAAPVVKPKPAPARVEEARPQAPPARKAPVAEPVEPKPAPKPGELPPEEDPTYFERMLEKIGF